MLTDADQIREDLGAAYNLLDGNDNAILSSLSETSDYLSRVNLALFEERDEGELLKRLENIRVEVKDISETVRDYLDRVETNPLRLAKVTERMNMLYDAIKHFKVKDEEGLVALHKDLHQKLTAIDFGDEDVARLEQEAKALARSLKKKADILTEKREKSRTGFLSDTDGHSRSVGVAQP